MHAHIIRKAGTRLPCSFQELVKTLLKLNYTITTDTPTRKQCIRIPELTKKKKIKHIRNTIHPYSAIPLLIQIYPYGSTEHYDLTSIKDFTWCNEKLAAGKRFDKREMFILTTRNRALHAALLAEGIADNMRAGKFPEQRKSEEVIRPPDQILPEPLPQEAASA